MMTNLKEIMRTDEMLKEIIIQNLKTKEGILIFIKNQINNDEFYSQTIKYKCLENERIDCIENYNVLTTDFNRKPNFKWNRLISIEKYLNNNDYLTALILSMTVLDLCSRIAYPSIEKDLERFEKFYDSYLDKYNIGNSGKNGNTFDCFNGYMCYLLRCRLVHCEYTDINEIPNRNSSKLKEKYDSIDFNFTNKPYSETFDLITGKRKILFINKSISQLVIQIIYIADKFYKNNDKTLFDECISIYTPEKFKVNFSDNSVLLLNEEFQKSFEKEIALNDVKAKETVNENN